MRKRVGRKKFASIFLCLAIVFQTGALARGEDLAAAGEESFLSADVLEEADLGDADGQSPRMEDRLQMESQTAGAGTAEEASPEDGLLMDEDAPDGSQLGSVSEDQPGTATDSQPGSASEDQPGAAPDSQSGSEADGQDGEAADDLNSGTESEAEADPMAQDGEGLLQETEAVSGNLAQDAEEILEDPDAEELQVFFFTETVELENPSVVSGKDSSVGIRRFRSVVQYNGCFGNQLSGFARTLYDARVDHYVTKRQTDQMILNYTISDSPYTFVAEYTEDGELNRETEEYKAFNQQVTFALQSSLDAFLYDHPEIFWFRSMPTVKISIGVMGNASSGYVGFLAKIPYTPTIAFSGADALVKEYDKAVPKVVEQIRAGADKNGDGIVEQLELLVTAHDYLCQRLYYDYNAYANYEYTGDYRIFCSAGAFLDSVGTGVVCEGYAKAFKVICDQLGIPCVLIGGSVVQSTGTEGHMWNGVQLNGKWYLVDVTWDDGDAGISYKYFLVGNNLPGRTSHGNFGGAELSTIFVYPQLETEALAYCEGMRHMAVAGQVVAPTCTAQGYTIYTCSRCGYSYRGNERAALGHAYSRGVCTRCKATESTHSYSNGICVRCGIGNSITSAVVSAISSQAYGAKALTPAVTVKFGTNMLKNGTDYTVTYKNNTKLGTASATVTGIGIYRGTVTKTFQIVRKSVSKLTISAIKDRTYTGKTQKPSVTIRNNGVKLTKNRDYTVSYSKNKSIGQAVITIKGKGNYTGTKKIYFTIVPKTPTLSRVKSSSRGKLTASWKRVSGVSGYQIQYSLKSNFSGVKSVTAGSSASSKTISKLAKGKVYYVRVRSYKKVSGKKYYSAWSKTKKVTVKKK